MWTESDELDCVVVTLWTVGAEDDQIISFFSAGDAVKEDYKKISFNRATIVAAKVPFERFIQRDRFAGKAEEHRVVVVLDPEVAEVFETPDSVNEILRALIKTMPRVMKPASKIKRTQSAA